MAIPLLSLKLKELRKNHGYTQKYISVYLQMSRGGYSQYESGHRTPGYEMLLKLTQLYQISIDQLINLETVPISNGGKLPSQKIYNNNSIALNMEDLKHLGSLILNSNTSVDIKKITQQDIKFLLDYISLNQNAKEDIQLFVACKIKRACL